MVNSSERETSSWIQEGEYGMYDSLVVSLQLSQFIVQYIMVKRQTLKKRQLAFSLSSATYQLCEAVKSSNPWHLCLLISKMNIIGFISKCIMTVTGVDIQSCLIRTLQLLSLLLLLFVVGDTPYRFWQQTRSVPLFYSCNQNLTETKLRFKNTITTLY